jgi:hypothetical protein
MNYAATHWSPVLEAMITSASALAGLVFVAVSINLTTIIKGDRFLAARAAETLAVLLLVVFSLAIALVPQNVRLVGAEILLISLPVLAITLRSQIAHLRHNPDHPRQWAIS